MRGEKILIFLLFGYVWMLLLLFDLVILVVIIAFIVIWLLLFDFLFEFSFHDLGKLRFELTRPFLF